MRQNGNDLWSYVGSMLNKDKPVEITSLEPTAQDMVAQANPLPEETTQTQQELKQEVLSQLQNQAVIQDVTPALLDEDTLYAISPNADKNVVKTMVKNQSILSQYGINSPERLSMFLGQMAHESAGFKAMNEYGGGSRYEGRSDLGNTEPGDGERYKGRGLIQLTGRYNYRKYGKMIGADLENNPELAADPRVALEIAAAYWKDRGLNEQSDIGNFREVTRRIQGTSTDALESRGNYFNRASTALQMRSVGGGFSKVHVPLFNMLSEEEKASLLSEARKNEPIFYDKNKKYDGANFYDSNQATFSETFSARTDEFRYLNTISGKSALISEEVLKALDENIKHAGDKAGPFQFVKAISENAKSGQGTVSLKDFQDALDRFKAENPNVSLPNMSADAIMDRVMARAREIEERYKNLDYGSFTASPGEALRKVFLYGADLAGVTAGSFQDPVGAALNLIPFANVAGKGAWAAGQAIVKNAGKAFLGFGAEQVPVQLNRKELGLSYGVGEGFANALMASAGMAAFQGLGYAAGSLWRWGSSRFGKSAAKAADDAAKSLDEIRTIDPEAKDFLKQELEDIKNWAKVYERNPYGDGFYAKAKFEANLKGVVDDLINERTVRKVDEPEVIRPRKLSPKDKDFIASVVTQDPEIKKYAISAIEDYEYFKKGYISKPVLKSELPESAVPLVRDDKIVTFATEAEARKFVDSAEGQKIFADQNINIYRHPGTREFYLLRSADLEPAAVASGRMDAPEVAKGKVGEVEAVGHVEDLAVAQKFPEYAVLKSSSDYYKPNKTPIYPSDERVLASRKYMENIVEASKQNSKQIIEAHEANFKRMQNLYSKETKQALLNDPDYQELLGEYRSLKQMASDAVKACFFGEKDNVNNN